jgi:hypothetical protein
MEGIMFEFEPKLAHLLKVSHVKVIRLLGTYGDSGLPELRVLNPSFPKNREHRHEATRFLSKITTLFASSGTLQKGESSSSCSLINSLRNPL